MSVHIAHFLPSKSWNLQSCSLAHCGSWRISQGWLTETGYCGSVFQEAGSHFCWRPLEKSLSLCHEARLKERGQPRSVHQEASRSGSVWKMALREMLSRDVFNGFGNCLILFQLSECCRMHVKHLGVEWSCEYVQGTQGISERHGIRRAGHSAKGTLGDLRQVGRVLGQ